MFDNKQKLKIDGYFYSTNKYINFYKKNNIPICYIISNLRSDGRGFLQVKEGFTDFPLEEEVIIQTGS